MQNPLLEQQKEISNHFTSVLLCILFSRLSRYESRIHCSYVNFHIIQFSIFLSLQCTCKLFQHGVCTKEDQWLLSELGSIKPGNFLWTTQSSSTVAAVSNSFSLQHTPWERKRLPFFETLQQRTRVTKTKVLRSRPFAHGTISNMTRKTNVGGSIPPCSTIDPFFY